MSLTVLKKMTTYEYIVRKRDEEESRSSDKDLKQEISTSKPVKVRFIYMYFVIFSTQSVTALLTVAFSS